MASSSSSGHGFARRIAAMQITYRFTAPRSIRGPAALTETPNSFSQIQAFSTHRCLKRKLWAFQTASLRIEEFDHRALRPLDISGE